MWPMCHKININEAYISMFTVHMKGVLYVDFTLHSYDPFVHV